MTPGQKHAAIAAAAVAPVVVYQVRELSQGAAGWPYSRFCRLLPVWLFLVLLTAFIGWFVPHIVWERLRSRWGI